MGDKKCFVVVAVFIFFLWMHCPLSAQEILIEKGKVFVEKKPFFRMEKMNGNGGRLYKDFSIMNMEHKELLYFRCDTSIHSATTDRAVWYEVVFSESGNRAHIKVGQERIHYQIAKLIIRSNLVVDGRVLPYAESEFCKSFPAITPQRIWMTYDLVRRNKRFAIALKEDGAIEQQKNIGYYKFGYEIEDEGDRNTIEFYLPDGRVVAKIRRSEENIFEFTVFTLKDRKTHRLSLSVRYLEELTKYLVDNLYL